MELAEDNIPESIFRYLFWENPLLCFADAEVVAIFFYDPMTVPFAYPVSECITEHRTDRCEYHSSDDMRFTPESAHEDHDIHARNCGSYDGERLDTRTRECDKIVPIPKSRDESSDPLDSWLDPFWLHKSEYEQSKRENSEKYGDRLREYDSKSLQYIHEAIVWKKIGSARKLTSNSLIYTKTNNCNKSSLCNQCWCQCKCIFCAHVTESSYYVIYLSRYIISMDPTLQRCFVIGDILYGVHIYTIYIICKMQIIFDKIRKFNIFKFMKVIHSSLLALVILPSLGGLWL